MNLKISYLLLRLFNVIYESANGEVQFGQSSRVQSAIKQPWPPSFMPKNVGECRPKMSSYCTTQCTTRLPELYSLFSSMFLVNNDIVQIELIFSANWLLKT